MMQERGNAMPQEGLSLERIVFFSDAVIAIAITLLAIEIRLPELGNEGGDALMAALSGLWPRYLSFVISFLVIGSFWWVHHRVFRAVRRYDEALIARARAGGASRSGAPPCPRSQPVAHSITSTRASA